MTSPNPLSTGQNPPSSAAGFWRVLDRCAVAVGISSAAVAVAIKLCGLKLGFTAEGPGFIAVFCAGVSTIATLPAPGARSRATAVASAAAPVPDTPLSPLPPAPRQEPPVFFRPENERRSNR